MNQVESFLNSLLVETNAEITDLTYCTAGWMGMGRVAHVLGLDGSCDI